MPAPPVVVLGAGAAGLMCAIEAGRRGRPVVVLERSREPGRKILISGGGRCNFTNVHCGPEHFLSDNPPFVRSALARFTPADFVARVEAHGIPYHEKKLGQLFCDRSARDVVAMLERECAGAGVRVATGVDVRSVERVDRGFVVTTARETIEADAVVVATGGLSIPRLGATGFGYDLAAQVGLRIVPTRPALVPFRLDGPARARWCDLAGVAMDCAVSAGGRRFEERVLVTHRGLSGPAILQISSYWREGAPVEIDLLPGVDLDGELRDRRARGDRATIKAIVAERLPRRFADRWFAGAAPARPVAEASNHDIAAAVEGLRRWRLVPAGTEGYEKAEVTAGGVDTRDLSSRTLEARGVPGLYFVGEVVDVTGHLGGFNFQWAWASGWVAGQYV